MPSFTAPADILIFSLLRYDMNEPITVVMDNAVTSGALEVVNDYLQNCYDVLSSIRVLQIVFLIWLVICAVYRFLNMFF